MGTNVNLDTLQGLERARYNMVEQQIRPWEVFEPTVLDLLYTLKRENFVPAAYRQLAFADMEVPLGHDAVMLCPKIEAKMLQAVLPKASDRVLEIGTGSGYMAALLGSLAAQVHTVEIEPALVEMARHNLNRAGFTNVQISQADASRGFSCQAPYDVIVVSGGLGVVPQVLLAQLKVGGRLCAIVGDDTVMTAQLITRRNEDAFETENLFETVAPMLRNAPQADPFNF